MNREVMQRGYCRVLSQSEKEVSESVRAKCEAIARNAAACAKQRSFGCRTVGEREAWTERKIAALDIAGMIAALKSNPEK